MTEGEARASDESVPAAVELANQIGYTRQYVSLAERPGKNLPSQELVRALDGALGATGSLLKIRDEAKAEQQGRRRAFSAGSAQAAHPAPSLITSARDDAVRAVVPQLRRILGAHDLPDDGPVRPLNMLDRAVSNLVEQRLQARYAQIAEGLPELLAEILRAAHTCGDGQRRQIARLLTLAYRAADGITFKFGYIDLSGRLIDLMRIIALDADDPLLLASVAYVRTETFFVTRDLDTAAHSLILAADRIPTKLMAEVPAAATYGSLHMRAAVVAARAGKSDQAQDHLSEARLVAARVPEGVYYGTAFGPSSVMIHDMAVAVELGDSPTAVERGGTWNPPRELPAERRSHYYIELARAQLDIGRSEDAYVALRTARQIAPQHIRVHPQVPQYLATLLRTRLGKDSDLLNFASWVQLTSW